MNRRSDCTGPMFSRLKSTPGIAWAVDHIPSNQMLRLSAELDIVWKVERVTPTDNLSIGVMWIVGAERWPPNQALKHNRP